MLHRFNRNASQELLDAVRYYEDRRAGLGAEFLQEIEQSITTIKAAPQRWLLIEKDIRRYRLDRFPYHLYYSAEENIMVIIAVAHQHRRPGYWKDRLD